MSKQTLSFEAWKAKSISLDPENAKVPNFLQCLAYQIGMSPEDTVNTDMQVQHDSGVEAGTHPDLSNMTTDDILNLQFAD